MASRASRLSGSGWNLLNKTFVVNKCLDQFHKRTFIVNSMLVYCTINTRWFWIPRRTNLDSPPDRWKICVRSTFILTLWSPELSFNRSFRFIAIHCFKFQFLSVIRDGTTWITCFSNNLAFLKMDLGSSAKLGSKRGSWPGQYVVRCTSLCYLDRTNE